MSKNKSGSAYVTEKQVRVRVQGLEPKCLKPAWLSHFLNFRKKVYFWSYNKFPQKSEHRKGLEPFQPAQILAFSK